MKTLMQAISNYVAEVEKRDIQLKKDKNDYFQGIVEKTIELFKKEYYSSFNVGDKVKIKKSVVPRNRRLSKVDSDSVGILRRSYYFDTSGFCADFPNYKNCKIYPSEMEVVEKKYEPFKNLIIPKFNSKEEYELFKNKTLDNILKHNVKKEKGLAKKSYKIFSEKIKIAESLEEIIGKKNRDIINFNKLAEEIIKLSKKEYYSSFNVGDKVKAIRPIKMKYSSYDNINSGNIGVLSSRRYGNEFDVNFSEHRQGIASPSQIEIVEKKYDPFKNLIIPELKSVREYEYFKYKILENILRHNIKGEARSAKRAHKILFKIIKETEETIQYKQK